MIIYFERRIGMSDIKHSDIERDASIHIYETDHFKSETLSVYFSLPIVKEESVIRSLLLSVLKRGTEKYPSQKDINKRLDELYATIVNVENQKFDKVQLLGLSLDIINSDYLETDEDLLPQALEVVSQILFHPFIDKETGCFSEDYVKSEKLNYKNLILSQMNEPRSYAALRCREETFASLGLSYKLSEMYEQIERITAKELTDYYKKVISSASYEVFYVGERPLDLVKECIKRILPSGSKPVPNICEDKPKTLDDLPTPEFIIEEKDISQGRLVISVNCGITWKDSQYYAMLLCNEILGSSPISKLMMNVREALSLCYECSSAYNSARGVLFINSGIDVENFELARSAIIEQIEAIKKGNISDAEFCAAQKSLLNVYKAIYDSPPAIERFYLGRIVCGVDGGVEDMLEGISALTPSDVIAAAKKLCVHTVYFLKGDSDGEVFCDEE